MRFSPPAPLSAFEREDLRINSPKKSRCRPRRGLIYIRVYEQKLSAAGRAFRDAFLLHFSWLRGGTRGTVNIYESFGRRKEGRKVGKWVGGWCAGTGRMKNHWQIRRALRLSARVKGSLGMRRAIAPTKTTSSSAAPYNAMHLAARGAKARADLYKRGYFVSRQSGCRLCGSVCADERCLSRSSDRA